MKRTLKQKQKTHQNVMHFQKQIKSQNDSKLGFMSSSQSANSSISASTSGQFSYKRQISDKRQLGSSVQHKNNPIQQQSFSQSNKSLTNTNRQSSSSIVKNDLKAKYSKKDKKISDISEILTQETKENDHIPLREIERQYELRNNSQSTAQTPYPNSICMFNTKSFSPISIKQGNRDLNLSPKDAEILTEQQMLLRSGHSASTDPKSVLESIMDHASQTTPQSQGSFHKKMQQSSGKRSRQSPTYTEQKLVFKDSIIKENSNMILHSNKKLHTTAMKKALSSSKLQQQKDKTLPKRQSPSVAEIESSSNHYTLKISDITDALNEFTQNEEAVNQSFNLKMSPIKQQDEFQTLILNQTNASLTGFQSHDYSMIKCSNLTSERNSISANEQKVKLSDIQSLLRNILIEGRVLWEVKWRKQVKNNKQKLQLVTFENEDALQSKYGREFEDLKQKYIEQKYNKV